MFNPNIHMIILPSIADRIRFGILGTWQSCLTSRRLSIHTSGILVVFPDTKVV